jgi:hypothetical protein
MKQLWDGVDEVDDLWNKKEQHGFTEVSQDGHHSKRHAREITESVADEYRRWVPEKEKYHHELFYPLQILLQGVSKNNLLTLEQPLSWRCFSGKPCRYSAGIHVVIHWRRTCFQSCHNIIAVQHSFMTSRKCD